MFQPPHWNRRPNFYGKKLLDRNNVMGKFHFSKPNQERKFIGSYQVIHDMPLAGYITASYPGKLRMVCNPNTLPNTVRTDGSEQ